MQGHVQTSWSIIDCWFWKCLVYLKKKSANIFQFRILKIEFSLLEVGMMRKKRGKGRVPHVPPEGVVFANITWCHGAAQSSQRCLGEAQWAPRWAGMDAAGFPGAVKWQDSPGYWEYNPQDPARGWGEQVGSTRVWAPLCAGSIQSWGSGSARNAHPIMDNLVSSFSSQACTWGALLENASNRKVFNFPYKIQPVKLNLTVAWRGRRRKRRRREALSSPGVTPIVFSHNSDFHGLWDWLGVWVWPAQKIPVLLQCCILTPQHLCLSWRIHLQKHGGLHSEEIYPWCSWLHPHERGI